MDNNRLLHVVTVAYGDGHVLLATEFMFKSLYRHNLTTLAKLQVSHRIYCRPDDAWNPSIIKHCEGCKALGIHTYINTGLIPNYPLPANDATNQIWIRNNYVWLCLADAMDRAMSEKAVMMYALPDHLFGHGLGDALVRMDGKCRYLVCCHPRVALEPALPRIEAKLLGEGFSNNGEIVDICMTRCRHPLVQTGLDHLTKAWRAKDNGSHYDVWFRDPVPVLIDPTKEMIQFLATGGYNGKPCFEIFDHDLVEWAWHNNFLGRITDSREFFWAELTSRHTYIPEDFDPSYTDPKIGEPGETFLHGEPHKFWKGKT